MKDSIERIPKGEVYVKKTKTFVREKVNKKLKYYLTYHFKGHRKMHWNIFFDR